MYTQVSFDIAHLFEFFGAGEAPENSDGLFCGGVVARELEDVDCGFAVGVLLEGLGGGGRIEWKDLRLKSYLPSYVVVKE